MSWLTMHHKSKTSCPRTLVCSRNRTIIPGNQPTQKHTMRIETGSRLLTLLVALLSAFSIGTYVFANRTVEELRRSQQKHVEVSQAVFLFGQSAEMLTMAARTYIATSDEYFRTTFHARLEAGWPANVIDRLRELLEGHPDEITLLESARENSEFLVALEKSAMQAAERGDREAAVEAILGPQHRVRETITTELVTQILRQLESTQREENSRLTAQSDLAGRIAWVTMALNVAGMLGVLLGFYRHKVVRPLVSITRQTRSLLAGRRDIHFVGPQTDKEAEEILELARTLEDYQRISAERDAQRQQLHIANAEQKAIVDSATSGIALIKDRIIERANRQLHTITGWSPWELVGQPTHVWYTDEAAWQNDENTLYEPVWRGETSTREMQMRRRDGSSFWARLTGRAVDADDRSRGSVWIIDDITVEHAAIEEMRKARALAEEAARMKSDFLANMSHEIRTPMNAIIGTAYLALKTNPSARQRDYLKKIQASSQILLGIINDILDLSKIEAGKLVVERTGFELQQVLDSVTNLVAEKAAGKGLELIVNIASDVPANLVGDPLRLGQVLTNYVNNAVKFTEHGEIEISVAVDHAKGNDLFLRFAVRDTGIGLTDEQKNRLFQNFEQADTSTTRKYGGTGLGLSIAKQLAELMGGAVGVDSEFGKGSTFWFTARLGRGKRKRSKPLLNPAMRGCRVLLADDSDTAREVIGEMLRSLTFDVTAVASGDAAIAEIARSDAIGERYEVALLDWRMAELDGIATARKIRALNLEKPPRLVIISAYGRDELFHAAEAAGIENVLIKPLSPSLLFDTIVNQGATEHEEATEESPTESEIETRLASIAGARVLLVEDNDMNQQMASELLGSVGLNVELAENGRIAVEKVQAQEFDVVLMDMQMPEMDGITATREIRKLPQYAELPIVAMTANAMEGDREKCLAAGMQDHVAKPIDPDTLWRALLRWIKPREGLPAGSPTAPRPGAAKEEEWTLPEIAGIDTAQGLKRAIGKGSLYLAMLRKFLDGQADTPAQVSSALDADDWQLAERLAHTLKGTAGNIGANAIQEAAAKLEAAIAAHTDRAKIDALLADLNRPLDETIAALRAALPAEASVNAAAADPAELRQQVARLAELLADDDAEASELLVAHANLFQAAFGKDYALIADAIARFDFEKALAALHAARAGKEE